MGDDALSTDWTIADDELKDISLLKARDLILQCFYQSQRDNLATMRLAEGGETEEEILRAVRDSVRLAFHLADGDFDNPRIEDFRLAVSFLCSRAAAWGTPPERLEQSRSQVGRVIQALDKKYRLF